MVKFDRCQHFSILQQNISTEIAIAQEEKKEKKTWQETVPKEFHAFKKVFTKESFDTLLEHRLWDHKKSGCIVKADSPQAAPFFFIKKKDG
jgi:hypothetical protein